MNQMISGSGLYPIRLLDESEWLTPDEITMVNTLETVLSGTDGGRALALGMLAPLIYNCAVKIILDNSGSMGLDMFGSQVPGINGRVHGDRRWLEARSPKVMLQSPCGGNRVYFQNKDEALRQLFRWEANCCYGQCPNPCGGCCGPFGFCAPGFKDQQYDSPIDPRHRRWKFQIS